MLIGILQLYLSEFFHFSLPRAIYDRKTDHKLLLLIYITEPCERSSFTFTTHYFLLFNISIKFPEKGIYHKNSIQNSKSSLISKRKKI